MCTHPIHIINRSRRFRPGIDKPVLTVPCGKCEECQSRKMDDWFIRATAEYKRVTKSGGFVWFPTLTYDNDNLPVWSDPDAHFIAPVFDKSHFVGFRNKLRVYLKRAGFDFTGDNTIRYLYVTEYGGQYGRPHIHCCLFVPKFVNFGFFKRLVNKAWIYGMVRYSPTGDYIKSVKGLRYCMKYMHKDLMYYEKYHIDDYISYLMRSAENDDSGFYLSKLVEFKKHLPHHCQSMGFGSDFVVRDDEFISDSLSSSRVGLYDAKFIYKIPLYYKRKFLYDFDKTENIYNINPRGVHIMQSRFVQMVGKLSMYYDSVFYSNKVETICQSCFPTLLHHPYYEFFDKVRKYDTKDIAVFSLVYDGVSITRDKFKELACYNDTFLLDMNKVAYKTFCNQVDNLSQPLIGDFHSNGALEDSKTYSYSDLPIYGQFYKALRFLEMFECLLGDLENNELLKQYYKQSIQFGKLFNV